MNTMPDNFEQRPLISEKRQHTHPIIESIYTEEVKCKIKHTLSEL